MAIPSGSGTEVLKTVALGGVTDMGSGSGKALITTTTTAIDTIISIVFTNIHASTDNDFTLYWDPASGNNLYILNRQICPAKGTFIFNDKIVLPSAAGVLYATAQANVSSQSILCSYIHQDWS